MTKHIKLQKDYTASCLYYQIKLPLDIEKNIPSDDPVRLLSTFVEGMKLSDLYNTYGKIKKDQVSPKQLLKIVIYAGMNRIYSSRDIEKSLTRYQFYVSSGGKAVSESCDYCAVHLTASVPMFLKHSRRSFKYLIRIRRNFWKTYIY